MRRRPGRAATSPWRRTSWADTRYVQGWASITASRETPSRAKGTGAGATRGVSRPRSATMLFFVTTCITGWRPSFRPANRAKTWSFPWYSSRRTRPAASSSTE
jgi:hypothetical protein